MSIDKICDFLCNNGVAEENEAFVKKCLMELEDDAWGRGYQARINHRKKHMLLKGERRKGIVKRFQDFLSDKTHNPKKA